MTKSHNGKVAIPLESVADNQFGAFKIQKWPTDIDKYLTKAIQQRWKQNTNETR